MNSRFFLSLVLVSAIFVGCSDAERGQSGEIVDSGTLSAFSLRIGDCFNDGYFESGEISEMQGLPCADEHDNEVYVLYDVTESEEYPGDEELSTLADEVCLENFEPFVGATYSDSVLGYSFLQPTLESWTQLQDREIICYLFHYYEEKLQGSMMGTGV